MALTHRCVGSNPTTPAKKIVEKIIYYFFYWWYEREKHIKCYSLLDFIIVIFNIYFIMKVYVLHFYFLDLTINLSKKAKTAGNKSKIKIVEHKVPSDIVLHIFAAIAEAKLAIIKVTIISIELEVKIV